MTNPDLPNTRESGLASGWTVQPKQDSVSPQTVPQTPVVDEEHESPDAHEPLSNVAVMLLGVFGGLYLLYTWGWFEVASANAAANAANAQASGIIGGVLQQFVFWAAPFAPLAWFVTTYLFTRRRGTLTRSLLLVLGVVVLLPFPILLSLTGGVLA